MMQVIFTQGAIDDLTDLKQSLKPELWKTTKNELEDKLKFIENNPLAQPVPLELQDINSDFRQGLTRYYRIIYEVVEDNIYIYLICNQARDLNAVFFRRMSQHKI